MTSIARPAPPDQAQRERALDPYRSILVQAPAGSGKTDLLTRRFLRLLTEVDDPAQIVAITFTKAAAAEMRQRIVHELEKAATRTGDFSDEFSMVALAARALRHSQARGWNLLELPGQLRISTIDSFCREIAIQQPILSGLGGTLQLSEMPAELYRRAARRTLEQLGAPANGELQVAIEDLLRWRDNNWQDVEAQLVAMLARRDQWMHDFVLDRAPDWEALRARLEQPFMRAARVALQRLSALLDNISGACAEAHALAQFACSQTGMYRDLAELAEFPCAPLDTAENLEEARAACLCLADMLLTDRGDFRQRITVANGFPSERKREKLRLEQLITALRQFPELRAALHAIRSLPPVRYEENDWRIVRACFLLLRHASGELKVAFAESGVVDFVEVAQLAQHVLQDGEGFPTEAGLAIADGIRHLLVDEFQDTSRRQHRLLSSLVGAWPDTTGRSVFVVGDPMQSIYFFRDADAELFPRVHNVGLELANGASFLFDFVPLSANFRTAPELVRANNETFAAVFNGNDDSGIRFSASVPARRDADRPHRSSHLHLAFMPETSRASSPASPESKQIIQDARRLAHEDQLAQVVDLITSHLPAMEAARTSGDKYRIAVLGRTRSALTAVADALRTAGIPFRAVDLENLSNRTEVQDVLCIASGLLKTQDRIAWLGLLRAPWCGLSLQDLHRLVSADDPAIAAGPVPLWLNERSNFLSAEGQRSVRRVADAMADGRTIRSHQPNMSLGTWIRAVWERLGGPACVDATALENLDLLWACLDQLPNGETDLLGDGLRSSLERMTAQPDPAASSDHGVQLMTIHKSKGLEFEVVIVPELQASNGRTSPRMLSWMERGLSEPSRDAEVTEFLIAPQQAKGTDRGTTKEWVDRTHRERELQEIRRVLYVAATRAREELHLFARPEFKGQPGQQTLCQPTGNLLATAWPALQAEVEARFHEWIAEQSSAPIDLAAQGHVVAMPGRALGAGAKPAILRRLPDDYEPAGVLGAPSRVASSAPRRAYSRHEGGAASRALGIAVHRLLEECARLGASAEREMGGFIQRVAVDTRSLGISPEHAQRIAERALEIVQSALKDPVAQWILGPRQAGESEVRWAGLIDGYVRELRVDRIFRAGEQPLADGDDVWWIVDYKTAQADSADSPFGVEQLRSIFAPQLELYAKLLRNLVSADVPIRLGLYYPLPRLFDWWEI